MSIDDTVGRQELHNISEIDGLVEGHKLDDSVPVNLEVSCEEKTIAYGHKLAIKGWQPIVYINGAYQIKLTHVPAYADGSTAILTAQVTAMSKAIEIANRLMSKGMDVTINEQSYEAQRTNLMLLASQMRNIVNSNKSYLKEHEKK